MAFYVVLIAAVAVERLAELVISKRNLGWARARGGREHGFRHYPFMVVLHTGLLVACLIEAAHRSFIPALGWPMIAVVVLAQALRWWCIAVLGPADPADGVEFRLRHHVRRRSHDLAHDSKPGWRRFGFPLLCARSPRKA